MLFSIQSCILVEGFFTAILSIKQKSLRFEKNINKMKHNSACKKHPAYSISAPPNWGGYIYICLTTTCKRSFSL